MKNETRWMSISRRSKCSLRPLPDDKETTTSIYMPTHHAPAFQGTLLGNEVQWFNGTVRHTGLMTENSHANKVPSWAPGQGSGHASQTYSGKG